MRADGPVDPALQTRRRPRPRGRIPTRPGRPPPEIDDRWREGRAPRKMAATCSTAPPRPPRSLPRLTEMKVHALHVRAGTPSRSYRLNGFVSREAELSSKGRVTVVALVRRLAAERRHASPSSTAIGSESRDLLQ